MWNLRVEVTIGFLIGALCVSSLAAQMPNKCRLLCLPKLNLEPTLTIENLFKPPRIAELENGVPVSSRRKPIEVTGLQSELLQNLVVGHVVAYQSGPPNCRGAYLEILDL